MSQQTDGASINGLNLTQEYFYTGIASASGSSNNNGVVSYNGTVKAGGVAGISGKITNTGNGFFTLTNGTQTTSYQILGSTADGKNLVFQNSSSVGSNSGPYYILNSSGLPPATGDLIYTSTNPYSPPPACFAAGTMILTPTGEKSIEKLNVGDLVVTVDGAHRPIIWIGYRETNCFNHPRPHEVLPYRVMKDAFATSVPNRDLYLSPGHAVEVNCLGPVLIPISDLANGSTISQVSITTVTYWHVELESHDRVIANGLASETYLDTGNRSAFNASEGVISLIATIDGIRLNREHCLPFISEGPILRAIREQLFKRAAELGWHAIEKSPEIAIAVDAANSDTIIRDVTLRAKFAAGSSIVAIKSDSFRPKDQAPHSEDSRDLGVCIYKLLVLGAAGEVAAVSLDHPALIEGFWPTEHGDGHQWRWTNGNGRIELIKFDVGFDIVGLEMAASTVQQGWAGASETRASRAA